MKNKEKSLEEVLEDEEKEYLEDLECNDWAFPDYIGDSWETKIKYYV